MSVRIAKILSAFAVVWQAQSLQGYGLMIKPFEPHVRSPFVGKAEYERLGLRDAVEKVAFSAKRRVRIETAEQSHLTSCHRHLPGDADFGELAQVLGGSGEVELVPGTSGSA